MLVCCWAPPRLRRGPVTTSPFATLKGANKMSICLGLKPKNKKRRGLPISWRGPSNKSKQRMNAKWNIFKINIIQTWKPRSGILRIYNYIASTNKKKAQARQAPLPKPIVNLVLLGLPLEVFVSPLALGCPSGILEAACGSLNSSLNVRWGVLGRSWASFGERLGLSSNVYGPPRPKQW